MLSKEIPILQYSIPHIQFNGEEYYRTDKSICKYVLNFNEYVKYLLIYTPNNSLNMYHARDMSRDNLEILSTVSKIKLSDEFCLIEFSEKINCSAVDGFIEFSLKNLTNVEQKIYVYGIGEKIFIMKKGRLFHCYSI